MEVNVLAVIVATVVMFAIGAIWYMVLFAKQWAKMHGMDTLIDEEMKEMSSKMGPYYGLQLLMTLVSAAVLAYMMTVLPEHSPALIALLVWLGFVLPTEVSAVIFGGTEGKYILPKIVIQASEALVRLVAAALVISLF